MPNDKILDNIYLDMAERWSTLSKANRMKVGCLIVKNGQIISDGYNGTPSGFDNNCEDENGYTKEEVLHAESNALMKLACSTQSSEGATCYISISPCFNCAKLLIQAKIKRVVFRNMYRNTDGLELLRRANIIISYENKELN